jgi:hypothetical protein
MTIPSIGIVATETVAIAKIDLLRMHAAQLYVAPAIGEFFDCKCWRNEAESIFFGHWADVERAHAMLAAVRSTMEREFADFFETGTGGENPKALAASFSKGMGHRISQRLQRLKAGRSATVLGKGKELAAGFANLFRGATRGELRRQLARLPMKPGSGPVIALSFLDVAQDLATATDPASPIDIGGFDIPIQAAGMLLAGAAQYEGRANSRIRANALRARHSSNPTQNARLTLNKWRSQIPAHWLHSSPVVRWPTFDFDVSISLTSLIAETELCKLPTILAW